MRPGRAGILGAVLGGLVLLAVSGVAAAAPHASLPTVERQFMCVTCRIPLNVAESPQADRERAYIQSLIDRGDGEAEIRSAMVEQYGPTVLGLPSTHGFDLAVYVVPVAVVLALLATIAVLLPRWRRESRSQVAGEAPGGALSASDAARLDADLARFDGGPS
ncbi:MAG TPA: cytochrome c-type biogenesis protein CcmH [Solirubrobacteraceae bacterium]|nr:cytochrome c-type biogenesis protein CcmH [Solirubrobacteraceae bacterium]